MRPSAIHCCLANSKHPAERSTRIPKWKPKPKSNQIKREIKDTDWAIEQNERKYNLDKVASTALSLATSPGQSITIS